MNEATRSKIYLVVIALLAIIVAAGYKFIIAGTAEKNGGWPHGHRHFTV